MKYRFSQDMTLVDSNLAIAIYLTIYGMPLYRWLILHATNMHTQQLLPVL